MKKKKYPVSNGLDLWFLFLKVKDKHKCMVVFFWD